jgi:hypothetical protein
VRGRALADFGRGKRDAQTMQALQRISAAVDQNGFKLSRRAVNAALGLE